MSIATAGIDGFDGRCRVLITHVAPSVGGGRYACKRVAGDVLSVTATIFVDGHDVVAAELHARHDHDEDATIVPMTPKGNDRYTAELPLHELGAYSYRVEAFIDHFATFAQATQKRVQARQLESFHLMRGVQLLQQATDHAAPPRHIKALVDVATSREASLDRRVQAVLDPALGEWMRGHAPRPFVTRSEPELRVQVDPPRARFSAWYELFPRSTGRRAGEHGTFRTAMEHLPAVKAMGFDVVYLPPIHPIGRTHRKGRNNTLDAEPSDPGSPWAIGGESGGHKSIHPQLGTETDFVAFCERAKSLGMCVALHIAFQWLAGSPLPQSAPRVVPREVRRGPSNTPRTRRRITKESFPFKLKCNPWAGPSGGT